MESSPRPPTPLHRAPSLRFADAARRLAEAARGEGLVAPTFRSPPTDRRLDRTVRRRAGGAVVAVRVRGRPFAAVLADMIEGVVVSNGLSGPMASEVRAALWATVSEAASVEAA
ncbi:MAG: hypothetical protein AAGA17_17690 [Actinomycetota bacterium]